MSLQSINKSCKKIMNAFRLRILEIAMLSLIEALVFDLFIAGTMHLLSDLVHLSKYVWAVGIRPEYFAHVIPYMSEHYLTAWRVAVLDGFWWIWGVFFAANVLIRKLGKVQ